MRDRRGGRTPKDDQLVREYRAIAFSTCGFGVNAENYLTRTWVSSRATRTWRPPKIVHSLDGTSAHAYGAFHSYRIIR
jgi:hypothetical protein